MSDIGIMHDDDALTAAMREARSMLNLLEMLGRNGREIPVGTLERSLFAFDQLSTLLELAVQERVAVARPQEEAHVRDSAPDAAPLDGVIGGDEAPDDEGPSSVD